MSQSGFILKVGSLDIIYAKSEDKEFNLKELQGFVGGLIEYVPNNHELEVIANEEGLLFPDPKFNQLAYYLFGLELVGDVFVFNEIGLQNYLEEHKPELKFMFAGERKTRNYTEEE